MMKTRSSRTQGPRAERPGMMRMLSKSLSLLPVLVLLMIVVSVTAPAASCYSDSQCRRDVCILNLCAPRAITGGTCSLDTHCFKAATESCINNKCLPRSPTGGPCDDTADCAKAGDICNGGKCETPFIPSLMVWDGNQAPLNPTFNSPSVVVNGILFVFEGHGNSVPVSVEAYNDATKTWTSKAPAPVSCDSHAVVAVGTSVFLIGGVGSGALTTFYRYDTANNFWETDWTQLPAGRYAVGAAAVGNTVFVFGGSATSGNLNTILSIDVSSKGNPWVPYANAKLPTPTSGLSATTVGTDIYITGGAAGAGGSISTALKYNTNTPNVSPISIGSMNQVRSGHISFYDLPNNLLYVVGVLNATPGQNAVEVLDLSPSSSGSWSPVNVPNYATIYSTSGGLIGSRFHFASAQTLQVLDITSPSSVKWSPFANSPSLGASVVQMTGSDMITAVEANTQKTSFYNTVYDTWAAGPDYPLTGNVYPSSALVNGEMFVMDGVDGSLASKVNKLNAAGDTWIQQDNMPFGRSAGCSAASGTNIFFYGGTRDFSTSVNSLFLMDTTKAKGSGQWSTVTPAGATPTAVAYCAAVVANGKLLIFGGSASIEGDMPTGKIQSFDIASKTWDAPPTETITPRAFLSAVFLKGFVFVIGGTTDSNGSSSLAKTEVFDVTTQKVTAIKGMPSPRFGLGSVTDGTSVFSVGGQTFSGYFPSLEKLHTP